MSHNSQRNVASTHFPSFSRKEMNLSEDEEESATLAEPMTLEGAKQLAQSSGSVATPAQTPPLPPSLSSPIPHPLSVTSPPPHSHLPVTSPSPLHHLSSPPLSSHHHGGTRGTMHSLSPPQHTTSTLHTQLTSPPHHSLASPSPHPHLAPLHHPEHSLWVSPGVNHEEESPELDEEELPSTVDIQAIRYSPSPEPAPDKLVTIDENWDTLEDQTESSLANGPPAEEEEGSMDEEEDDDDESDSSDSESNLSDNSCKSLPAVNPQRKLLGTQKFKELNGLSDQTRSASASPSGSFESKSDSDSHDSDSDTSGMSSSDGSSSSSTLEEDEEEEDTSSCKPLPRMKPQLTASNSCIAKKISSICLKDSSLSLNSEIGDCESSGNYSPKHKFGKETQIERSTLEESESQCSSVKKCSMAIEMELNKSEPNPCLNASLNCQSDSKTEDDYEEVSLYKCKKNPVVNSSPRLAQESLLLAQSVDSLNKCESRSENTANLNASCHHHLQELKVENNSNSNCPKAKDLVCLSDKKGDLSCISLEDEKESDKKIISSNNYSAAELEERRLEKKRQMDKEFDRLLKSSKPLTASAQEGKTITEILHENVIQVKEGKPILEKSNNSIIKAKKYASENLASEKTNCVTPTDIKEKKKLNHERKFQQLNKSLFEKPISIDKSHSQCNGVSHNKDELSKEGKIASKLDGAPLPTERPSSAPTKAEPRNKLEVNNSNSIYYSSDSKSNCPSCSSSSSSSSDSEGILSLSKKHTPKRMPSLNVTAKVISERNKKSESKKSKSKKIYSDKKNSLVERRYTKSKTDNGKTQQILSHKSYSKIRPTIADLVKVRERRSSFEKESGSEKEQERKGSSKLNSHPKPSKTETELDDDTTSSSETSEDLNEKVDLDTELTQTFSVSENNFNQGRLTLKIAAMKMAKFGKTGLRELANGGLPTRSDLLAPPLLNLSSSAFKRPRMLPHSKSAGSSGSRSEPPKVKTAAERKTYVDALPPPCGSICTLRTRKKKGSGGKTEMRVPATALCRSGGACVSGTHGSVSYPSGSHNHHHYHQHQYMNPHTDDDEEQISRIAHHLSQISHDHMSDGLQVLDQEDLAAILPDVSNVGPPPETSNPVRLDPFPEDLENEGKTDAGETASEDEEEDSEDLSDLCVREAISSIDLLVEENPLPQLNNVFGEGLCGNNVAGSHSRAAKCTKSTLNRKSEHLKLSDELPLERKKSTRLKPCKDVSIEEDPDTPTMPELESYAGLDCNASNVSPDSGIQSVNGSPLHHVGSPHHHSPFYSGGMLSAGTATNAGSNSNNESLLVGKTSDAGCGNSNLRPFSPNLSLQDSPPPPTLLPAVTPPHLVASPRYNYDDSPNSPPMPSLKCQVDPPPWEEKCSNGILNSSLNERAVLNENSPGRPEPQKETPAEKPKRPRGRPKGSKNKKKSDPDPVFTTKEKKPVESFIRQPYNALAKLDKINESSSFSSSVLDYSAMRHKWRGATVDADDLPPTPRVVPPLKRGPGRPKKTSLVIEPSLSNGTLVLSANKDTCKDGSSNVKIKRPVGRPRKYPKPTVEDSSFNRPVTLASKKCFSEKIMHKIINENVRNSEKSDKLSVQQLNNQVFSENGRSSEKSDKLTVQHLNTKVKPLGIENVSSKEKDSLVHPFSNDETTNDKRGNLRTASDPYVFRDHQFSNYEEIEHRLRKERRHRKLKGPSDGIPLDDKKKRRGRRKELPAIFEKVYGSIKGNSFRTDSTKGSPNGTTLAKSKKKKKKHKKQFKSKHKNIVDPVFLAEVESLITEIQKTCITKSPLFPQPKPGETLMPSIFKIRKVTFNVKKRRINEKPKTSDKESGTEGENSKEKTAGKRKKKIQEVPKQGRERSEANEQRLPLKKRHRHISTAVPTSPDPPKIEGGKGDVVNLKLSSEKVEKDKSEKLEVKDRTSSGKSAIVETNRPLKTEGRPNKTTENTVEEQNSNKIPAENLKSAQRAPPCEKLPSQELKAPHAAATDSSKTKTTDETQKKTDSSLQTLVTTTPKKRHRLEAELASTKVIAPTITTVASIATTVTTNVINSVPSTLLPASSNTKTLAVSSKIKVEKEIKNKEVSHPPDDERIVQSDSACELMKPPDIKQCDENKCVVVIEKCDQLNLIETNKKLQSSESKEEEANVLNDTYGGTHSDSDIPSEHEPLCESDQSGFMSDKEGPKELPKKVAQKRRKKKRDLHSPKRKSLKLLKEETTKNDHESSHKKKIKRRKTNKTGFPTIRRRKKKKTDAESKETKEDRAKEEVVSTKEKSEGSSKIEDAIIGKKPLKDEGNQAFPAPKPRGRPKKVKPEQQQQQPEAPPPNPVSKDLREILRERKSTKREEKPPLEEKKNNESTVNPSNLQKILERVANGRCKRKRDLSEDSAKVTLSQFRKTRRIGEDEHIDDSDCNLISSECQMSSEPASSDESYRSFRGRRKVPRWKKRYLIAGLLSNYYKQDEIPRRNGDVTLTRCRLNYDPENHVHGLLPPPSYCKKWLRERPVDFLLPYDLWWLHVHDMLPGRDLVPSWNFRRVKSNIYYDVRPPNYDSEIQACNCKRVSKPDEKSCSEDCINRMMFIECSPHTCPLKEACSNQRIQRHEFITGLQRFMTTSKGWGIKSNVDIKQGTFILEYVGEVVSEKEFKCRMQTKYSNDTHHYCLNLDRGTVIDGHRMGGDCRFVNHSCNPNCEMQKWFVNGQYRMALFALTNISVSEELNYDYNFSLFNPTEGQPCKCGADNCRGVIGGRSQRLNAQPLDEKKKALGRNKTEICKKRKRGVSTDTDSGCASKSQFPVKPLSHQQRLFILSHRCFLLRNLEKVKRSRDRLTRFPEKKEEEIIEPMEEPCHKIQKFLTHFTALNTARSVKTRRLAQAEDDPEMTRVAKLAQIFKDIYDKLVASRDDKEKPLATPFMTLPSKKKYPNYYIRIGEPIDLALIEKNILTGHYATADTFDDDIMKLFANNLRFFGRNTNVGQMAVGLRKVYSECKLQFKPLLEEVLGEDQLPQPFADCTPNEEFEDEDVIRCVCNLPRDEGMMIQCEQCLVWQHCDCMGVTENESPDHYLCEECSPRLVSPEVPVTPQSGDSQKEKYFITLLRDNLQIKLGDSVYILRDRPTQKTGERRQPAYKLAKDVKPHDLSIVKVENLWIDEKGDKFAFGHHFLMPHETFHEPWRKFFPNEVIRSPMKEFFTLDMIVSHCWVMDLNSYCKGRPIGAIEEHVYVCEFRVDLSARIFSKISKPKYPICVKPFAFISFSQKLTPQRTYAPHEVISSARGRALKKDTSASEDNSATPKGEDCDSPTPEPPPGSAAEDTSSKAVASASRANSGSRKSRSSSANQNADAEAEAEADPQDIVVPEAGDPSAPPAAPVTAASSQPPVERAKKRTRLNSVATKLLNKHPSKGAVADLSYLLDNSIVSKRSRKKTAAFSS